VNRRPLTVYVLSDSVGDTGEAVALAAVAQFEPGVLHIERLPKVKSPRHLKELVEENAGERSVFFYTLVTGPLRCEMERLIAGGVTGADLLGPAVTLLEEKTGLSPTGEAGLIRRTDEEYFARIEAMEFAVAHDDGRNPESLPEADVVLLGVSRSSKTPIAMYLATKGWRAANVPLVLSHEPPPQLFQLDPRRVFGLVTTPDVLLAIRQERVRNLGQWVPGYADREHIERELKEARAVMRRIGCMVVRTDNRAVEESVQEILQHMTARGIGRV